MTEQVRRQSRVVWAIAWVAAVLPLLGWWLYGLFDMDEGFYGAVVAEMNRRSEWITPYYNGQPWFEKPILLYWLGKPSMLAFGDVFGPRLPSILATLGTYALVAWFARRRWGDHAARWCLLVTASSILVVGVGRMMMTDAILDVCLVGAFVYFWESVVGDRRWRLLAAFFLGLSVLAKGPVGLLLFVPVAGWTLWRERELRPAFRGWWILGTLILAATIASWYLPAYLVNGQTFVQKFLIEQNLNRFTGGDPAHSPPFLTGLPMYFLVLLVGMAPWSFFVWKAWPRNSDPLGRYLAVWALVPFIFFTISKAKLPHYVLPSCVPIALIVGSYLARVRSGAPGHGVATRIFVMREHNIVAEVSGGSPDETFLRQTTGSGYLGVRFPILVCLVVALIVNGAFLVYYRLSGKEELDRLALYVRDHAQTGEDVAAYQMPRRQHDLGTLKLKIQETAQPSLAMILNRVVAEPNTMDALLADPLPEWVLTRMGRITDKDFAQARDAGRDLKPVTVGGTAELYYLSGQPGARTRR